MQHAHVLKKLNFNLLTHTQGSGGCGGVCRQNIFFHVAAFVILFKFDMQYDLVLKKLNYDLLTPGGEGGGLWEKYLLSCCFIS